MRLTEEQKEIIASEGNLKVNAVAGSGKTTTILEYAKRRPKNHILYLAFNKSVKTEADQKLSQQNISNVTVETAHSLAFKQIVPFSRYKIRFDYKPQEIAQILNIPPSPGDLSHLKLASHVLRFAKFFCNSPAVKVADLDYSTTIYQPESKAFVMTHYDQLLYYTRHLLAKMYKGEIDIIHDFYLKQFQLARINLSYDYILFDEGQDASPSMLEAFLQQKANKVIIGDEHQQIYSWRFATNALQQVDFTTRHLSNSFRFNHEVAHLATSVLDLKKQLGKAPNINIFGMGNHKDIHSRVTLARTNSALLSRAIELLIQQREISKIYFEGQLGSYTFSEEGGSVFDILNLYNGQRDKIRDPLIASVPDFEQLKNYTEETEDASLKSLVELVEKYHNDIPYFLKRIKESNVDDAHRDQAEMVFSTVHKSKGLEYDEVFLTNDFFSEQNLYDIKGAIKAKEVDPKTIEEELNLLYVAITRAKAKLHIPLKLLPTGFYVEGMKTIDNETKLNLRKREIAKKKKSTKSYVHWTKQEEAELTQLFLSGKTIKQIAGLLGRTSGAIQSRVEKLDLWDQYF
ncbi:ATP-dependent helicase [Marinilabiliaceae bacterium JC017]|nr:ATP-dependent helicase [Marinilabiliaceae bacterium JC017]